MPAFLILVMVDTRNKIRTVVIDEDKGCRESSKTFIRNNCPEIEIIAAANNVKTAVPVIEEFEAELVLTEVTFPDGTAFDILRHFEEINFKIIFLTHSDEYALQAFHASAIDYLKKPACPEDLMAAIRKAVDIINQDNLLQTCVLSNKISPDMVSAKKIVLKTAESIHVIALKDLVFCESERSYSKFWLNDGKMIMVSKPLKEYEDVLCSNNFFRTHKSYIINCQYIERFERNDGGTIILRNDRRIPVAYRKKSELLNMLSKIKP